MDLTEVEETLVEVGVTALTDLICLNVDDLVGLGLGASQATTISEYAKTLNRHAKSAEVEKAARRCRCCWLEPGGRHAATAQTDAACASRWRRRRLPPARHRRRDPARATSAAA